jgi:hypothetical protein
MSSLRSRTVREIRRLHGAGEPLNISAVKRDHPELLASAFSVKPFLGWRGAIEAAGLDYRQIRVHLEPYVQCELCGEYLLALASHLTVKHGTGGADYLIDYPDARLVSEELSARMRIAHRRRRRRGGRFRDWEPVMTPEYVLDRMWVCYQAGLPMNFTAVAAYELSMLKHASEFFGCWDAALERLWLNPKQIRLLSPSYAWTRLELLSAIKKRQGRGAPLSYRTVKRDDPHLIYGATRLYGNWRGAVIAAGIDYEPVRAVNPRIKFLTGRDVVLAIRRRKRRKQGLSLAAVRARNGTEDSDRPLFHAATRHFGGWAQAVQAAGFDYGKLRTPPHRKPRKYPAAEDVTTEIKRRKRKGLPLNTVGVNGNGAGADRCLYASAVRDFGAWRAAIEAAGLDIAKIGRCAPSPYASRTDVLGEIRRRKREDLPLSQVGLCRGKHRDCSLINSGTRLFGAWRAAIEAAGLDYDEVLLTTSGRKYPTHESVLRAIRARRRAGLPLNAVGVCHREEPDQRLYSWAGRYFGSWTAALTAAGLDPAGTKSCWRKYSSAESVLREIRRRHRCGAPLNAKAVRAGQHADCPLHYAAQLEFGAWAAALTAAELPHAQSRRKYPDRNSVIKALRSRKRAGLPVSGSAVCRGESRDSGLVYAGRKEFGNWVKAREAAGV